MAPNRCILLIAFFLYAATLQAAPPICIDNRLVMELVAREPEIVTPTGIAVDRQGRIWVIENNTHQRAASYHGPASDRIRVFADFDANGRPRKVHTFAEGFRDSMGLALGERDAVYLATRSAVHLLRDTVGDGVAHERKIIVRLETSARYPHNGLSGFAFDRLGNLYFGLGENEGLPYKLVGADGSTQSGGGEGGSIYCCRPDGSQLMRIATGFWNPFGLGIDPLGRLFAVDNDPDSRGPCRLLHIVQGGDYGYRYRNGRKGLHPFTAWNGELPGTLPMVAGTGEAPCAVVPYKAHGLPSEYQGKLLVTSWGDHLIERFQLSPRGASFTSQSETVVSGGEDFRPVGMVTGPDGALYISDWVDKSYPVHGKGRIWRLRMKEPSQNVRAEPMPLPAAPEKTDEAKLLHSALSDPSPYARMQALLQLRSRDALASIIPVLADRDPFLVSAALSSLGQPGNVGLLLQHAEDANARVRVGILVALRQTGEPEAHAALPKFLADADPEVRRAAIQWVGEDRLKEFAGLIDAATSRPPVTRELFEASLATRALLGGEKRKPGDEIAGEDYIAKVVQDAQQPPALRAIAMQMLRPDHPGLRMTLLKQLLAGPDSPLRRETVRTLAMRSDDAAQGLLREIAADAEAEPELRSLAVMGLAHSAPSSVATRRILIDLLAQAPMARDVLRSLRETADQPRVRKAIEGWWKNSASPPTGHVAERQEIYQQLAFTLRPAQNTEEAKRLQALLQPRPRNEAQWRSALSGEGDTHAGERLFFHPRGPQCYVCHRVDGRGGAIGPDLSKIGASLSRDKLIDSILNPSKEIAPQFVAWHITTRDGKVRTGLIVEEGPNSTVTVADAQGKLETIHRTAIEERHALPTSIMPANLPELMTRQEFVDLLAFLRDRK